MQKKNPISNLHKQQKWLFLELVATWTSLEMVVLKIHKLKHKKSLSEAFLSGFGYGAVEFCSA